MNRETFTARRVELRKRVANGAILLSGAHLVPRNYEDNVYPFRQDSHFLYYVGVAAPDLAALLLPDGSEVLYGTPDHPDDLVWFGSHPTLEDHAAAAGIEQTADMDTLSANIAALQKQGVSVHYLPPYRGSRVLELARLFGIDPDAVEAGASATLVRAVAGQRSTKTDAEIEEIEEALEATAAMYSSAMAATRPGCTEAQIAAALVGPALARDLATSFPPIVTVRGEVLHNTSYANTLQEDHLLLVDSGAESRHGYAADITRTWPVARRFSSRQRDIYEVVLAAQLSAIDKVSPRITNRELHLATARVIAEGLKGLGLMQGDLDDAVAAGAHALFMPHGLGHMLGLDVHDMEDLGDVVGYPEGEQRSSQFGLGFLRLARRLEPGFVITIEPGVYFIPALIDQWQAAGAHSEFIRYERLADYRGLGGIRIEDDVLVTEQGGRVLGPGIPKTVAEIEQALAG